MRQSLFKEVMLPVSDLQLGMHVVKLDRPWEETSFLIQGFIIQSNEELVQIQSQCRTVYVQVRITEVVKFQKSVADRRRGRSATDGERRGYDKPLTEEKITYINQINFNEAMGEGLMSFTSARSLAAGIMDGLRIGQAINMNRCREVVEGVVGTIIKNQDVLRFLSQIKHKDEYTAEHSMNVCVLSATFARFLGLAEFEIRGIAIAGLLHDVGKAKVPLDILNKPSRFNQDEARIMSSHARWGRDMLMSLPQGDRLAVDVAHSHHERVDGKGYPRGLKAGQIPYYAKVVAIADAYDAITSNRVYGNARTSYQALSIIKAGAGTQFDTELAGEFIKCIGLYSPGSLVELTNGEVGVVLFADSKNRLRPRILLVRDEQKNVRFPEKLLNLNHPNNESYAILQELPNGSYDIDVGELVAKGLRIGS